MNTLNNKQNRDRPLEKEQAGSAGVGHCGVEGSSKKKKEETHGQGQHGGDCGGVEVEEDMGGVNGNEQIRIKWE